jgi:hypothetical protein
MEKTRFFTIRLSVQDFTYMPQALLLSFRGDLINYNLIQRSWLPEAGVYERKRGDIAVTPAKEARGTCKPLPYSFP